MNKEISSDRTDRLYNICQEIHQIAISESIPYAVYGSAATIANVGHVYRNPQDIDILFEEDRSRDLHRKFVESGFTLVKVEKNYDVILARLLYRKQNIQVEARAVHFNKNGYSHFVNFPCPIRQGLVFNYRSKPTKAQIRQVSFLGYTFNSLRAEALLDNVREAAGLPGEPSYKPKQRKLDAEKLRNISQSQLVRQIRLERPGYYLGQMYIPYAEKIGKHLLEKLHINNLDYERS